MNTKDLVADLRNKLSPIKNYLALQRQYESVNNREGKGFMDGYKLGELQTLIEKEKINAEQAMPYVEAIIHMIENNLENKRRSR